MSVKSRMENFYVDYVYKQSILSEKEKNLATKWGKKSVNFIVEVASGIIKFFVLKYIFIDKMYKLIGFEKTLLFMVLVLIILMQIFLKNIKDGNKSD